MSICVFVRLRFCVNFFVSVFNSVCMCLCVSSVHSRFVRKISCVSLSVFVWLALWVWMCVCVSINVRGCLCMCVCVRVCMCVCVIARSLRVLDVSGWFSLLHPCPSFNSARGGLLIIHAPLSGDGSLISPPPH